MLVFPSAAEEMCRKLLVEDPEKEHRRRELLSKKAQLQRAKDELSVYLPRDLDFGSGGV